MMPFAPPIAKVVTPAVLAIVPTICQGSDVIFVNIESSTLVKYGWFTNLKGRFSIESINDLGIVVNNDRDTVKLTTEEAIRA
jgi:hypothetical protein